MKRVVIRKPGGYARLELENGPDPEVPAGQVLVRTEAIGINYADCIIRMGYYSSAQRYVGWPITPGFDFAGRVAAVGEGVEPWRVGDAVFGVTRFGGYSSHIVVPPEQLFALPEGWTMARAAAFPTVHLTAWYALCELSRPRPGMRVLVHSAAGGVGTAALRIARCLELEAFGVVGSSHKISVAREAGAKLVVDRSTQSWWEELDRAAPGGFDVILESSGVATLRQSYRRLRPAGRLLVFGMSTMLPRGTGKPRIWQLAYNYVRLPWFNPLHMLDKNATISAFNLSYLFERKELLAEATRQLLDWAAADALPAPPIREYPLDQVAEAHRALESGSTVGKLVLVP